MSWKYEDRGSDDNAMMMSSMLDDETSTRLLNQEDHPVIHRRPVRSRREQPVLSKKAKEERKYKYSLVSILIVGICLIMMVSIGLGYQKCQKENDGDKFTSPEVTKPAKPEQCVDTATGKVFPWQLYRLPTKIIPESYNIFLHPNLTLHNYTGLITIKLVAKETTDYIILHSRGHLLRSAKMNLLKSKSLTQARQILHCEKLEMVAFNFGHPIQKGSHYKLVIDFFGNVTDSLGGFYLSNYKQLNGEKKVIGTTQFESVDARAAFPCFDEPAFKANFSLNIVRDGKYHVLSNMPLVSTEPYETFLKLDKFQPSVKMSTYLVAFIISSFISQSNFTKGGVKVSVYSSPDKINETQFALEVACNVLDAYDGLFGIPFPLPKLDLVAIPDFAAGAMENWGLVTYRETALLYNPLTSSIKDQEWVAMVIAHELAHQWFGNLVTMEWWNDLWLNEGFASYMEYMGVDMVKPSWNYFDNFVVSTVGSAMAFDSSTYTHPMSVSVTNTPEIEQMFDTISYSKGASIIAMLVDYLGHSFFDGVDAYLKKYAYGNAENRNLISVISSSSSKDNIQEMMDTWTMTSGLPVVNISVLGKKVTLQQSRFLYSKDNESASNSEIWHIPISYVTNLAPRDPQRIFLREKSSTFDIPQVSWIKFNHNLTGYYRVSYDTEMWNRLITQLVEEHNVFSVSDRISLVSDAFAIARIGGITYDKVLKLADYIKKEKEYPPIVTSIANLEYIDDVLRMKLNEESHSQFQSFLVHMFLPLYNELAWKDEAKLSRTQSKLQSLIIQLMCSAKYKHCQDEAYQRFTSWMEHGVIDDSQNLHTIFKSAVDRGSMEDWNFMWNFFSNSTDALIQDKLLSAIAVTTNVQKIAFLQKEMLLGTTIRSQSASLLMRSLTSHLVGGVLGWRFVKEHWEKLVSIHPVGSFTMRRIVGYCLGTIMDEEELTGAEMFFKSKSINELQYVKRLLETTRTKIMWSKFYLPLVMEWLNENQNSWISSRP